MEGCDGVFLFLIAGVASVGTDRTPTAFKASHVEACVSLRAAAHDFYVAPMLGKCIVEVAVEILGLRVPA